MTPTIAGPRPATIVRPHPAAALPAIDGLFIVATHKVRDRSAGLPMKWLPYGLEHAWRAGTRQTLCGQVTTGWTVFWDRGFNPSGAHACPDCIEASLPEASRRRLDPRR